MIWYLKLLIWHDSKTSKFFFIEIHFYSLINPNPNSNPKTKIKNGLLDFCGFNRCMLLYLLITSDLFTSNYFVIYLFRLSNYSFICFSREGGSVNNLEYSSTANIIDIPLSRWRTFAPQVKFFFFFFPLKCLIIF